jgi:phosphatidylethanolamine-binding protein (PEBP) family uncharacterized protein
MLGSTLGCLLNSLRRGEHRLLCNHPAIRHVPDSLPLSSSAFLHGKGIPLRHAGPGTGDNVSPPLSWSGLPLQTVELALVIENLDTLQKWPPDPTPLIVTGISPSISEFAEGDLSPNQMPPSIPSFGRCAFGHTGYLGPEGFPKDLVHQFVFQLFALNIRLNWQLPPTRDTLLKAIRGHVIAKGRLDGFFSHPPGNSGI